MINFRFTLRLSLALSTLLMLLVLLPSSVYAANNSECLGVTSPTAPVYEGYKYTTQIIMKNTGDTTWLDSTNYRLGSQSPENTFNWDGNRVLLTSATTSTDPVDGKTIYTFTFTVTVQAPPGTHNFSWQMLKEGVAWFGAACTASITVLPSPYTLFSPLFLKNHPAGYVPGSTKVTENSPYHSESVLSEKQWSYVVVNNPDTTNSVDILVTLYSENGTKLTSFPKTISAGGIWNSAGDTRWTDWNQAWVNHDPTGTADDSVVGWAKVVSIAAAPGSAPLPIFGQQRIVIDEPKTDSSSNPIPGPNHLLTDMSLTTSAWTTLYGGYFMRNWPAGYPNDSAVVQRTYINIANPNNSAANVTLNVYKEDGTLNGTPVTKQIAAFGSWYSIGDSAWDGIPIMDTTNNRSLGWVEITSDKPVTGFNRTVAEKPNDTNWLRILTDFPLAPPSSSVNLYTSLFVKEHNSGFTAPGTTNHIKQWSYLTLHNPGTTSATATVKIYAKAGGTPYSFSKPIAAHETWFAKDDTPWNNETIGTVGWVEVNSTAPLVGINRVSIGGESGTDHYYWTDYPMDFLGSKKLYSAYFLNGHPSGYWEGSSVTQKSYLHIANPSASSAVVTIRVLTSQGTEHAKWDETIPSKNSWISIDDTDWTGITGLSEGWVEVSSTQPVVATNRITFRKPDPSPYVPNWLRLMTDAPLTTFPPTPGTLNIVPDTADSPAGTALGTYGVSGLRSNDPNVTSGSGSNYYNSLTITQGLSSNATSENVALVGTAFTSKTSAPANNTLYELTRSAYADTGFVLLYANKAKTVNYCGGTLPSSCTTTSQSFTANKYYVYFKGSWSAGGNTNGGQPYSNTSQGLYVNMSSIPTFPTGPTFSRVRLFQPIGNHTWGTYGYVMDSTSGGETAQAINPPTPTPTPTPLPTSAPTPTPTPSFKRVFITSNTYNGNLGGLDGADRICQTSADSTNPSLGGTWKAWLSIGPNNGESPDTRFNKYSGTYQLLPDANNNIANIATSWTDLTNGSILAPINVDETRTTRSNQNVWTNTRGDGTVYDTSNDCADWGGNYSNVKGYIGNNSYSSDARWTIMESSRDNCDSRRRFYCFEQ